MIDQPSHLVRFDRNRLGKDSNYNESLIFWAGRLERIHRNDDMHPQRTKNVGVTRSCISYHHLDGSKTLSTGTWANDF